MARVAGEVEAIIEDPGFVLVEVGIVLRVDRPFRCATYREIISNSSGKRKKRRQATADSRQPEQKRPTGRWPVMTRHWGCAAKPI